MMMAIVAERADADVYRMKAGNKIVGFAIRMSNGVWMQFGPEMAAPISAEVFATPKAAAKAFPI
jgi:hypothetical protein